MEADQGLHRPIVMDAKCKFLTSWWKGGLGPQNTLGTSSVSPVFIQPLSIKLNNPIPKKLPTTTSFLSKTVITQNDRLLFIWGWQSLDSNSGCHPTVHVCVCVCVCVYVCMYVCVGVKDTVQSLNSLTVRQNSQTENMKNCSESQS